MTSLERVIPHSTNILFNDVEYDTEQKEIGERRTDAANALTSAIDALVDRGFTTEDATLHIGYSVHAFLPRSGTRNRIIHVELNPNSRRFSLAKLRVTEMDREKLEKIQASGLISTGAEDAAITRYVLPDQSHREQANDCLILLTGEAVTSLLEQAFERLDIADDNRQISKPRGLARIKMWLAR